MAPSGFEGLLLAHVVDFFPRQQQAEVEEKAEGLVRAVIAEVSPIATVAEARGEGDEICASICAWRDRSP